MFYIEDCIAARDPLHHLRVSIFHAGCMHIIWESGSGVQEHARVMLALLEREVDGRRSATDSSCNQAREIKCLGTAWPRLVPYRKWTLTNWTLFRQTSRSRCRVEAYVRASPSRHENLVAC